MKKVILAIAAIGTIATANAQHSGWHAKQSDSTSVVLNVQIDDAIELYPEAGQTVTSAAFDINALMPGTTLSIGSDQFYVWSNRSYNVTYNVSGTVAGIPPSSPALTWDGDGGNAVSNGDTHVIPLNYVHMTVADDGNLSGAFSFINDGQNYGRTNVSTVTLAPANAQLGLTGTILSNARPAGGHAVGGAGWGSFGLSWTLTNPEYAVVGGNYSCTMTVIASQE